jgi:putative MFS transporter
LAAGILGYFLVPTFGWKSMFLIGALPGLLIIPLQRTLPESPRWLASRGRLADADAELERIEHAVVEVTGHALPLAAASIEPAQTTSSWRELFASIYLRRTLVVWVIWFGSYMIYYGIGTWLPTLYRTVFHLPIAVALQYGLITNVVGLAGATVCALTIDKVGRRAWFGFSLIASGLLLCLLRFLDCSTPLPIIIWGSAGYFFATAAAVGAYLYTPELYPTRMRALGTGTATAWLRVSSMIGPVVVGSVIGSGIGSVFLIFGIIAVVAGLIASFFAVESKERILEELSP